MDRFLKTFHLSWSAFVDYLPALFGGIVCFIITLIAASIFSKFATKYTLRHSRDGLIANFIGKIIWSVIFVLGTVLALGIFGLGTISNKILAGAGITTFVVGFALKDIGENFLSGIILAFSRPYHVGNLIECSGVKGVVKDMTMRQTTVEALNGKMIMIPNSMILNNPLIRHMNDDNNLRQEFFINVENSKVSEAISVITDTINAFKSIGKEERKKVKVVVDSLQGDKVKLLVIFWFDPDFKGSRSNQRSGLMLAVINKLNAAGYKYSG